jgi:hypothetical protein
MLFIFGIGAIAVVAPPAPPSASAKLNASVATHAQKLQVSDDVLVANVARDDYTATSGYETLEANGTNADWAQLVMMYGNWPLSKANITVMQRWMRQENGPNNWWNRNNPLNNGYGSGGGAGTGSYANLVIAAQKCAENLHRNPGFAGIAAAFADGTNSKRIEHAIWASPWATSHYANGQHWAYTPVDQYKAPASAW